MNRWQGDWNCKEREGSQRRQETVFVNAIIYRQVCLFSTRNKASSATHTHWSGKSLSPQWHGCCHLSKWCYILLDPQPSEVTLDGQGSRLSDQWAPRTPADVFRGLSKERISKIICDSTVRTWWLLVVLHVTVRGHLDEGKSSSTSTGFKGFSQVNRITYREQQQPITCGVNRQSDVILNVLFVVILPGKN